MIITHVIVHVHVMYYILNFENNNFARKLLFCDLLSAAMAL